MRFIGREVENLYNNGEKFMSSNRFRVWLNNEYLSEHPSIRGSSEAYSKAVTQSAMDKLLYKIFQSRECFS